MADRALQNDTHIDQMRELIVGPQMREHFSRLDQLETKLTLNEEATQKRFDEVMDGFLGQLNRAVADSDKKVRTQDLKAREERSELQAEVEQFEQQATARLDRLEADLTSFQEEMRKRLDTMQESLTGALNTAIEASDKRVQSASSKSQEQVTELRQRTKRTEEKLDSRYQALDGEIESSSVAVRTELSQSHKGLQDEIQRLRMQLVDEIKARFLELRDAKVSKDEISEILFEFGMRIKGMDIVSEPPQLAAPEPPISRIERDR